MKEDRFKIELNKCDEVHTIIIKDKLGGSEVEIVGENSNIKDNLENMKKINFLLNMQYEEILDLKTDWGSNI